ncbi:hypothetical protein D3C76_1401520 [compost metagenome]
MSGVPSKFTTRLFSVRPDSCIRLLREVPSTRIRCVVPSIRRLQAVTCWLIRSCRIYRRCFFSSSGTSSTISAAGVPGRAEKIKLKLVSKFTSPISFMVRAKSSVVSPGKPTIKSELIWISGRASRSLRIIALYSSTVWVRPIRFSTRSEPHCTGRCRKLTSSGVSR